MCVQPMCVVCRHREQKRGSHEDQDVDLIFHYIWDIWRFLPCFTQGKSLTHVSGPVPNRGGVCVAAVLLLHHHAHMYVVLHRHKEGQHPNS